MAEFYVTEEKAMAPRIAGEWPNIIPKPDSPHGRLRKVEGVQDAIDDLEKGCKLYCGWYDKGQPQMDGGAMAYELVSFMRQALSKLR